MTESPTKTGASDTDPGVALETRSLSVFYGDKAAVSGISLSVPRNRVVAFIGPSGCGKSAAGDVGTWHRMLSVVNNVDVYSIGKIFVVGQVGKLEFFQQLIAPSQRHSLEQQARGAIELHDVAVTIHIAGFNQDAHGLAARHPLTVSDAEPVVLCNTAAPCLKFLPQ